MVDKKDGGLMAVCLLLAVVIQQYGKLENTKAFVATAARAFFIGEMK